LGYWLFEDSDERSWRGPAIERESSMAAKKKKARRAKKPVELIISKARVKNAVKKCNVGSEFYEALDGAVRELIKGAEGRAVGNKRKTLKAVDL
jgi:histone H3/H4